MRSFKAVENAIHTKQFEEKKEEEKKTIELKTSELILIHNLIFNAIEEEKDICREYWLESRKELMQKIDSEIERRIKYIDQYI